MTSSALDKVVFVVQVALFLAIAIQFRGYLHSGEDFILGRRRIGMPFSGAFVSMNSVPFWWLLIVIGLAFSQGRSAIWCALALIGGIVIGGWYVAPRLRALTNLQQRGTFSELLVGDAGTKMRTLLLRSALAIVAITLVFSSAVQLQFAAQFLSAYFDTSLVTLICTMSALLLVGLLLAGVWTTAAVDVWQILVGIGVAAIAAVALGIGVVRSPVDATFFHGDWFGDQQGILTLSFTLGVAFIAGDIAGQAPLLTRYMACSSDVELGRARVHSLLWALLSLSFALAIGFSARALGDTNSPSREAFTGALLQTLTPSVVTLLFLLAFGAAAASIGTGLQTVAAHIANDLRREGTQVSLLHCRISLVAAVVVAALLAAQMPFATPRVSLERMLFCWHALGAAFGPLLIVRLSGKRVRPGSSLGSIWSGFLLTLVFYLMPDTPGELLERGLPFAAALGIALSGGERRRNPDRADRGERTVHDRLPI